MDFKTLSKHDDILASYFLDNLYLWFTTVRMNSDPIHATGEQQQAINMIQQIVNRPGSAEQSIKIGVKLFLEFPYFKDYVSKLSLKEARCFHHHLKRYILMFSHQAGFEVSSTTRYTGTMEACILATRDWTAGETVQCCSGAIVDLTKEDDAKLKSEGRDFSVMVSTRKKCTCLFLGPARFMNHDCDANCEFTSPQPNTISFKVQRDIRRGEEMTVYYGDHYFGIDNCECRCVSCERMQEGSFSVEKSDSEETEKDDAGTPETPTEDENTGIRRSGRVKKEVDYVYKDVLTSPKIKSATLSKSNKVKMASNTAPLVEITNGKSLEATMDDMTMDDPEEMEINSHSKKQKPVEMDLNFICNEQSPSHWLSKEAHCHSQPLAQSTGQQTCLAWGAHAHMNDTESYEPSWMPSHPSPKPKQRPADPELAHFYDWLDDQSDVSDAEGSIISEVNAATCCQTAKEYKSVITSTGQELCSRCYRHYKIYELEWPSRKKPIVVLPPSPPASSPSSSSLSSSLPLLPSSPSAGSNHATKQAAANKPSSRSKSKSLPRIASKPKPKPYKPLPVQKNQKVAHGKQRAKLFKTVPAQTEQVFAHENQQLPSTTPQYHPFGHQYQLPPNPPAPFALLVSQPPPPPQQSPHIDPVLTAFELHALPNYSLTSLPASSTFNPALPFAPPSPSSIKAQLVRTQEVYTVHPRPI